MIRVTKCTTRHTRPRREIHPDGELQLEYHVETLLKWNRSFTICPFIKNGSEETLLKSLRVATSQFPSHGQKPFQKT